jgi:hypothetical protein
VETGALNRNHDGKPTGREKRRFYVIAFAIALGVDLLLSALRGEAYRPTLLGLAIMITAGLFFLYSLIRER